MAKEPKLKSHDLLVGPGRAPARAMLKAVGFTDEDLSRPLIGVANTWIEVMPCNLSPAPTVGTGESRHPGGRRHTRSSTIPSPYRTAFPWARKA